MASKKKVKKFVCRVFGIHAFGYTMEGKDNLDEFRCFLANFSATLGYLNFGYICAGILVLIILISIFGRIKENYKWFILYQALWDLIFCYDFICDNQGYLMVVNSEDYETSCVYDSYENSPFLQNFFIDIIWQNHYTALLILSFSRFIALYFMNFYDKLTRGRRILYTILIFTFIMNFAHIDQLFLYLWDERVISEQLCLANQRAKNLTDDLCDYSSMKNFYNILCTIFNSIVVLKPAICLLLSLFAAIMLIVKILKQAKFQIKHNRRDFLSSLRITLVIGLQSFINFFVFLVELIFNLENVLSGTFGFTLIDVYWPENMECNNKCLDWKFPIWLYGYYGLTDNLQTIIQLRIFIESIIVLLIMTGYREAIVKLFVFIYNVIKNPRKAVRNFQSSIFQTTVTSFT